jgi:acyl carrier protein
MNIVNKVIEIVANNSGEKIENIHLDDTTYSLGLDSLDELELVMELEEAFDIEIQDHEAEKFTNIQSIVDFIRHNVAMKELLDEEQQEPVIGTVTAYRPKTINDEVVARVNASLNSGGRVEIPKGLTREQKRQFIVSNGQLPLKDAYKLRTGGGYVDGVKVKDSSKPLKDTYKPWTEFNITVPWLNPEMDVDDILNEFKAGLRKKLNLLVADNIIDGDIVEEFDKLMREM